MAFRDNIESDYTRRVPVEHRKRFAQFFTPAAIAEVMAGWLLKNEQMETVLEPAFGLGIFSRVLLSKKKNLAIKGFDVDECIFNAAKKQFCTCEKVHLLLQDYMYNDWENNYDGIICNPPYFKFHDYDNKSIVKEIERKLSCKLNGFTNLYTLFLLKSIHQLKPNGRCAYIVPSEFLNSDYGKLVKLHLIKTKTLRHIIIFDAEEKVFDDALTTACIILCAKDNQTDKVKFSNISSASDLHVIRDLIDDYPANSDVSISYRLDKLDPEIKWKNYYQKQQGKEFEHLVPFSKYAKVMRGIATGSNDFFSFTIAKAKEYGIGDNYLLPCICKCTDVKNQLFTWDDFNTLKNENKKVFLLNAFDEKDANVVNYLRKGENEGINKKFLTASRNPWYALEKRPPAPIWVSVFNRKGLRFVRNTANVSNLTTFHCVYLKNDLFSDVSVDLLFAYLLTDTARMIFEDNSREYGNGLQKFEPNDLNKGMMIDLQLLSEAKKRETEIFAKKYLDSGEKRWISLIDDVLRAEVGLRKK